MKLTVEQRLTLSEIVHKHLSDINFNVNDHKGCIELAVEKEMSNEERHAIITFVGCKLSSHGLVYWPIAQYSNSNLQQLKIGFRPFTSNLDASLLASIYH